MATLQIYMEDNSAREARLFDNNLSITFTHVVFEYGFSKSGLTKLLKCFGYVRSGKWQETDWGWESEFIHKGKSDE